jgi:GT2 family glycosyltransferase
VISQTGNFKTRVVIVVNGQLDDLQASADYGPSISVVRTGVNLGYAGGLELARRMYPSDYFWILQDDLVPEQNCLEALHEAFLDDGEHAPLAIASPVESGMDESSTRRLRFGVFDSSSGERLKTDVINVSEWLPRFRPPKDTLLGFVYLSGALMWSPALEKIGGFDPSFWPLMLVDADTCFAVQAQGYSIARVESAIISHPRKGGKDPRPGWKPLAHSLNLNRLLAKHFSLHDEEQHETRVPLPSDITAAVCNSMSSFIEGYTEQVLSENRARKRPRTKTVKALRRAIREMKTLMSTRKEKRLSAPSENSP